MVAKAYLSNISPRWPIGKQEELFAEKLPGWPKVSSYCDVLTSNARKAHNSSSLVQRAALLRPTARARSEEVVHVASLACLAWGVADFTEVVTGLAARDATLIVLDIDLTVPPNALAKAINAAVKAFQSAKRTVTGGGARVGAMASAATRRAGTDSAVDKIRDRWGLPNAEWPTRVLLKEADLSYNTAVDRLGKRPVAQKAHAAAQKRKARRK